MSQYQLYHGDCLEIMPTLADACADMILADLPYGTTSCHWDSVIPFRAQIEFNGKTFYKDEFMQYAKLLGYSADESLALWTTNKRDGLWENYKRLIKPRGAIVLFGSQPFTSALVMSNVEWFKYSWVWDKNRGNGHLVAKHRPLQQTEDIAVFCNTSANYFPQMSKRETSRKFLSSPTQTAIMTKQIYQTEFKREDYHERFPVNLLNFSWSNRDGLHPTQKPVDLLAYLIRTYTNEGETVLDNTMGSGSTIVAAIQEGRKAIGIERDEAYFAIAEERIRKATYQPSLFTLPAQQYETAAMFGDD